VFFMWSNSSLLSSSPTTCEAPLQTMCLELLPNNIWKYLLEAFVIVYSFFGLAIVCDDHLCHALDTLCERYDVREDVAGATFLALGSAAPEIVINLITTLKTLYGKKSPSPTPQNGVDSQLLYSIAANSSTPSSASSIVPFPSPSPGNSTEPTPAVMGTAAIIGSGLIAFLVIPSACALAAPAKLELKRRPLFRDVFTYAVALLLLCLAFSDGVIQAYEGIIMLIVYAVYLIVVISAPHVRETYRVKVQGKKRRMTVNFARSGRQKSDLGSLRRDASSKELTRSLLQDTSLSLEEEEAEMNRTELTVSNDAAQGGNKNEWRRSLPNNAVMNASDVSKKDKIQFGSQEEYVVDNDNGVTAIKDGSKKKQDEEEEEDFGLLGTLIGYFVTPLNLLFKVTCPPCEMDSDTAYLYPITFLTSFLWVALFSFIISTIVETWAENSHGASLLVFGMFFIAVGAEVPDTIQSVTQARRNFGSLAVSNSTGSQIINILLGLGLPWTCAALAGQPITFRKSEHEHLLVAALFQTGAIAIVIFLMFFPLIAKGNLFAARAKCYLTPTKGKIMLTMYAMMVVIFIALTSTVFDD